MNITVNIDEVTLDTIVREAGEYGDGQVLADLVAAQIVDRLVSREQWYEMSRTVSDVRREVIREAVRPQIEEAIAAPFHKTSAYGEPVGEPVTLRQIVVDEARKMLTAPVDNYSRDKGTVLQVMVRKEVEAALGAEVRDAVKKAREQVSAEIGQMVANAVQAGLKAR